MWLGTYGVEEEDLFCEHYTDPQKSDGAMIHHIDGFQAFGMVHNHR
jgi:hypothetical protein